MMILSMYHLCGNGCYGGQMRRESGEQMCRVESLSLETLLWTIVFLVVVVVVR
jgi:hypothetical protein